MDISLLRPGDQVIGPSGTRYVVLEVGEKKARLRTDYPTWNIGVGVADELTVDQVALDGFQWKWVSG